MQPVTFRCVCCRRIRHTNPRVKNQRYCGDKRCQQARKSKWEREKLQADPDYRINKKECQVRWKQKNPDYWKQYRQTHPEFRTWRQVLKYYFCFEGCCLEGHWAKVLLFNT